MRYLPIFSLGLLDASAVIGASVLLNVDLCIRKLESVLTRLKGKTHRVRSYSIAPEEIDFVGLLIAKKEGEQAGVMSVGRLSAPQTGRSRKPPSKWHVQPRRALQTLCGHCASSDLVGRQIELRSQLLSS
jgi:hypothetical protein